jgi:hypothetical protein
MPSHPAANNRGYILRARYILEKHLKRRLLPSEHVHHINDDPTDDRVENLEIVSRNEHPKRHRKLDYKLIKQLRQQGLGYRRIAKRTGYARSSIQSACKVIESSLILNT